MLKIDFLSRNFFPNTFPNSFDQIKDESFNKLFREYQNDPAVTFTVKRFII